MVVALEDPGHEDHSQGEEGAQAENNAIAPGGALFQRQVSLGFHLNGKVPIKSCLSDGSFLHAGLDIPMEEQPSCQYQVNAYDFGVVRNLSSPAAGCLLKSLLRARWTLICRSSPSAREQGSDMQTLAAVSMLPWPTSPGAREL